MSSFSHKLFNCSFAICSVIITCQIVSKRTDEQLNSFFKPIYIYFIALISYFHTTEKLALSGECRLAPVINHL